MCVSICVCIYPCIFIKLRLCGTSPTTSCCSFLTCTNFSALVNLSTNRVFSVLMMLHYLGILARIMLGPFPVPGLVAFHYLQRATTVSFLTMLAFNRVLKTLFILDFQRMTAVPEKCILISMGMITFLCTSFHIFQEVLARRSLGLDHFPRGDFYDLLSKVIIIEHQSQTFLETFPCLFKLVKIKRIKLLNIVI